MKRLITKIGLLSAALLIVAGPAMADDQSVIPTREPEAFPSGKDQCLLVAMNCGDRAESIQNRIDMIQREINKGTAVYTEDELKALQRKLENEKRDLLDANVGGA